MKTLNDLFFSKVSLYIINCLILLSFCYTNFLGLISKFFSLFSFAFCGIFFFIYLIDHKFSKFDIALIIYFVFGLFSSILGSSASILLFLEINIKIIGYTFYLEKSILLHSKKIIITLENIFLLLIFINFITILLFPNGLYVTERYSTNWFFQYDNTHIFMYMPAIAISFLSSSINDKKISIKNVILLLLIVFSVFYCKSSNSIIGLSIFIIYLLFNRFFDKIKLLNSKTYFIIFILIFVFIVLFRIQYIFEWLIVGIFNKKLTFTGRTYIWDKCIKLITKAPLLGYGFEDSSIFSLKLGSIYFTHAHNTLLNVMYRGGLFLLVSFLSILVLTSQQLYIYKKYSITRLCSIIFFSCLVMMNFEAREDKIGLYILLIIFYCIKHFIKNKN